MHILQSMSLIYLISIVMLEDSAQFYPYHVYSFFLWQ